MRTLGETVMTDRSATSQHAATPNSVFLGSAIDPALVLPVLTSPGMLSGDPVLESIATAIGQQREMLLRLENEQQRRLLQMQAEAEERRRRGAEAYERELAKQAEKQRKLEALEAELCRCAAETKAAREEFEAAKKLWETALHAKDSEVETLRQNLDLMRANSNGKETAAITAARAELNEVRAQLKNMQERYNEVQDELMKRRKEAEQRLKEVSGEVNALRRRMSDVYAAVKEPRPVIQTIQTIRETKESKNVCVGVDFTPEIPRSSPVRERKRPLPRIDLYPPMEDLNRLRRLRMAQERRRSELVKRLNQLYVALATRRTQVRDEWKRRYYAAKKQAPALEERMGDHRVVLDSLMRRAVTSLRHYNASTAEDEDLARTMDKRREVTNEEYRLAEVMLTLTKAIKLRTQAETEGRLLMSELDRRRGEMSLVRSTSPNRRAYVFSLSPRRQQVATSIAAEKAGNSRVTYGPEASGQPSKLNSVSTGRLAKNTSSRSMRPIYTREDSIESQASRQSKISPEQSTLSVGQGPQISFSATEANRPRSRVSSARSISPTPV